MQKEHLYNSFEKDLDYDTLLAEAVKDVDTTKIRNMKQKSENASRSFGNSFTGVQNMKAKLDKKDPFLIYKISDGSDGSPKFVFKTSRYLVDICRKMNRHGDHFLGKEFLFFDGSHKRCKGFKTITLSVYHPMLRKLVALVKVELESEKGEYQAIIWRTLNEALKKQSGNPNEVFDPAGWMADEMGGNWNAIKDVYGEDALTRVASCMLHFKSNRNIHRNVLSTDNLKVINFPKS